jgi:WD40 repeat protein
MKLIHSIKLEEDIITTEKSFYQGQICLSPNSEENNYLVYSNSLSHGLINIYDTLYLAFVNFIQAHKNPLFKMCINSKGNLLASCSINNGSIKILSLPKGEKLYKFKRGYTYNTITGMNFNIIGNTKLVTSSGSGNIHIFDLDKSNKNDEKENVINKGGYMNKINQLYNKVTKECKDYINNKNLTTTVNINDLKGENLLFFKEGKGVENKNSMNVIVVTLEGFFFCINIDSEQYIINNIFKKYIDSIKLKS